LMPVFSGLFAVPAALDVFISDFNIPEQGDVEKEVSWRGGLIGFVSGLIAGTVPGVGAGAATSFLSPLIEDRKEVLTGLGAVNTSDIFISFIALFVLEKARSGASVAIQTLGDLSVPLFLTAVGSSFLAVGLSLPLTARTEKVFLRSVRFFDLNTVLLSVLSVILGLTVYFTGFLGVLVLVVSSLVGFLAWFKDCRTCAMAVLIVPALFFYLGVGIFI